MTNAPRPDSASSGAVGLRADDLLPDSAATTAGRRRLYRVTTAMLVGVLGLGVIDVLGWWDSYGVSTAVERDSGGGYDLAVRYAAVTRPALATPLEITVVRQNGFDAPVVIAVDQRYLAMWDANAIVPSPSSETVNGTWVEWEFDPPRGTTLTVVYDARIEPAQQSGRDGAVAVMDQGRIVVDVDFRTRVMP